MPTHVVLLSLFLFGLLLPIVAIIGPTQLALDKNLRVSLDASRRNGSDESTTATVLRLEQLGISWIEICVALFLLIFGFGTYYWVPLALLNEQFGMFIGLMLAVSMVLLLGQVFLWSIITEPLQQAVSKFLTCCCGSDKSLLPILSKRISAGFGSNIKISIMITFSVSYLIMSTSLQVTSFSYFQDLFLFIIGGDILLDTRLYTPFSGSSIFLDEMAISNYLDPLMEDNEQTGEKATVVGYTFVTCPMNALIDESETASINSFSEVFWYDAGLYGVQENFKDVVNPDIYLPIEVEGAKGSSLLRGDDVVNAHKALYSYDSEMDDMTATLEEDEHSLVIS